MMMDKCLGKVTQRLCFCPHRWIVPNESEKFPAIVLEQLLPAVRLLGTGQRSVGAPHRAPLPRGTILLPAQPPPPVQPRRLALIPPPPPPPPLLVRRGYRHPGLSVPTSGGPRDVQLSVWPALRFPSGAIGEVSSPADGQLGTRAQRLALWPGREGGFCDGLGLERCVHWGWSRDRTQHWHRLVFNSRLISSNIRMALQHPLAVMTA